MSTELTGSGDGGTTGSEPPDPDDFHEDGSIHWGQLVGVSIGAFATLVTIGIVEFFGLLSSGILGYATLVTSGISTWFTETFETGETVVVAAFDSAIPSLATTGPFAFPIAVVMVVTTGLILIWGVGRLVS